MIKHGFYHQGYKENHGFHGFLTIKHVRICIGEILWLVVFNIGGRIYLGMILTHFMGRL